MPEATKISICFTRDEVDWLSWVMTDVLGKATHVPPHDEVAKKISAALVLIDDINAAAKEMLSDAAEGANARCNADA